MFKSVFTKYVTAFALIIGISFVMLTSIISSKVRDYAADSKRDDLRWFAQTVHDVVSYGFHESDEEQLIAYLNDNRVALTGILDSVTRREAGVMLMVTDTAGNVILSDSEFATSGISVLPDSIIGAIVSSSSYEGIDNLDGALKTPCILYGVCLTDQAQHPIGAVVILSTYASENELISTMNTTVVMASLWLMLAALIAVYFISDRMIGPLRSMITASKQFAKGKFDTRIEVSGQDEVAELAAAFNQMAESLDHIEKMRNSFLASVSHDLRTPMTTIAGFIDGINSGAIPPDKHEYYLGVISSEVHRLSRLVSQLLDISRLESGDRKLVLKSFDICEMARLILISFEQKIDAKHLDVDFLADDDRMMVTADQDAIHQILYNICDNAIKFSYEGGKLNVAISRHGRNKTEVSVYNEGVGIPAEDIPFIFERFYKGDKSRGLDKTGVGLGLYIAKTIIDAHGEEIHVDSEEGKFCRFRFTLSSSETVGKDPAER